MRPACRRRRSGRAGRISLRYVSYGLRGRGADLTGQQQGTDDNQTGERKNRRTEEQEHGA